MPDAPQSPSTLRIFGSGFGAGFRTIFPYVLFSTYIGIGALAHDFGFSLFWVALSTLLIWAGPAQLILITALGSGVTLIETGVAVSLSAVRLLPMTASLIPLMKAPLTRAWHFLLPAHFTTISLWAECIRVLPGLPREQRLVFANGIGTMFLLAAIVGTGAGYYLAGKLPQALSAALLFLTPLSFITATARNSRQISDRVAFGLGFALAPLFTAANVGLELMWTGVTAGTLAYLAHRWRKGRK